VATAYVMLNDLRVTLAIRFVLAEDETVAIVQDLQYVLKKLKIRVRRLFLPRIASAENLTGPHMSVYAHPIDEGAPS
jgi:hypothetical protein